jgi:hypothetical protein
VPDFAMPAQGRFTGGGTTYAGVRMNCIVGRHARCAIIWPVKVRKNDLQTCQCMCHKEAHD